MMERTHPAVQQCPFGILMSASLAALTIFGIAYALLG
jgi:hypothetical protein